MRRLALDSSCMVAAVSDWHQHHSAALSEIEWRLDRGERFVISVHAVLESYSVLTRLSAPHRLSPKDAWLLLRMNFVEGVELVSLDGRGYCEFMERLVAAEVGGGRSYDALIAACADQSEVDTLLTFNRRHFESLVVSAVVVEPSIRNEAF